MTAKTILRTPLDGEPAITFVRDGMEFAVALDEPTVDRILAGFRMPSVVSGCWIWQRAMDRDGYGATGFAGRSFRSHRISYQIARGPIPSSLEVDHLCKVRACGNPLHLEAVPPLVNLFRGGSPAVVGMRRDRCVNGHEFDGVSARGWRTCSECLRANQLRYQARRTGRA
jgi:hypothetical protein